MPPVHSAIHPGVSFALALPCLGPCCFTGSPLSAVTIPLVALPPVYALGCPSACLWFCLLLSPARRIFLSFRFVGLALLQNPLTVTFLFRPISQNDPIFLPARSLFRRVRRLPSFLQSPESDSRRICKPLSAALFSLSPSQASNFFFF